MSARRRPSAKVQAAMQTVTDLLAKYELDATVPDVRQQIRARFTQADLDQYTTALASLDANGGDRLMTQTDIPQDALPEAARDIALMFLNVQRKKEAEHREQGDRLSRAAATFIHLARERDVPWTDIAHALGVSVWSAHRIARRRPR